MQSLDELRSFLTSVLVVALSEDVGCINGVSVPVETSLQSANNFIIGVHVEDFDPKDISELDDFNFEDTPLSWQKWSDDLYAKAPGLGKLLFKSNSLPLPLPLFSIKSYSLPILKSNALPLPKSND